MQTRLKFSLWECHVAGQRSRFAKKRFLQHDATVAAARQALEKAEHDNKVSPTEKISCRN